MKKISKLLDRLKGLTDAVARYPLTAAFLLAAAVILAVSIHTGEEQTKQLLTCAVGAVLSMALQAAYERFFRRPSVRAAWFGCGFVLTLGYYLLVRQAPAQSLEITVRTSVTLLALFFAYLWIPVIRSRISFNESFMAAFRSVFHALLYTAVLFGGCGLIITAIDTLLVPVSENAYAYTADFIFVLFGPLFFLSLIPVYPGKRDAGMDAEERAAREERIAKAAFCPRFLEVLISYIVVPLAAVFTVILAIYILLNIQGEFWTNNLLEPMLVSYAVTVILVYILASRLENRPAVLFRRIFPKVLVPIVLFQIASSVLSLRETGMTHTRYFVILFGIFAACAGVVMSVVPVRKNGILAAMLIGFSAVSVIPPVDAFTVSRASQQNRLETVLIQNGMLQNNTVIPNGEISEADKETIVSSAEYLNRMDDLGGIEWLPEDFDLYRDFYDTFGFRQSDLPQTAGRSVSVSMNGAQPIDISGYHLLARTEINKEQPDGTLCQMEYLTHAYLFKKENAGDTADLVLTDEQNQELIRFHLDDVFDRYDGFTGVKSDLSLEDATFSAENDRVKLTVVVQSASMERSGLAADGTYYYADFYVLLRFA